MEINLNVDEARKIKSDTEKPKITAFCLNQLAV